MEKMTDIYVVLSSSPVETALPGDSGADAKIENANVGVFCITIVLLLAKFRSVDTEWSPNSIFCDMIFVRCRYLHHKV